MRMSQVFIYVLRIMLNIAVEVSCCSAFSKSRVFFNPVSRIVVLIVQNFIAGPRLLPGVQDIQTCSAPGHIPRRTISLPT